RARNQNRQNRSPHWPLDQGGQLLTRTAQSRAGFARFAQARRRSRRSSTCLRRSRPGEDRRTEALTLSYLCIELAYCTTVRHFFRRADVALLVADPQIALATVVPPVQTGQIAPSP